MPKCRSIVGLTKNARQPVSRRSLDRSFLFFYEGAPPLVPVFFPSRFKGGRSGSRQFLVVMEKRGVVFPK